jgi:GT2 family glycosyltransferase
MVKENPKLVWSMGGIFNPVIRKIFYEWYYSYDSDLFNTRLDADWLTGMGTLIPGEIIKKASFWDAHNFPQYHGDSDFTYRAKN